MPHVFHNTRIQCINADNGVIESRERMTSASSENSGRNFNSNVRPPKTSDVFGDEVFYPNIRLQCFWSHCSKSFDTCGSISSAKREFVHTRRESAVCTNRLAYVGWVHQWFQGQADTGTRGSSIGYCLQFLPAVCHILYYETGHVLLLISNCSRRQLWCTIFAWFWTAVIASCRSSSRIRCPNVSALDSLTISLSTRTMKITHTVQKYSVLSGSCRDWTCWDWYKCRRCETIHIRKLSPRDTKILLEFNTC